MLLVLDRDDCLSVFPSVAAAEAYLETIDIEDEEYLFCDQSGQPYAGEVLKPTGTWTGGAFRLAARGLPDVALPGAFLERAKHFYSRVPHLQTLDDARQHLSRAKASPGDAANSESFRSR